MKNSIIEMFYEQVEKTPEKKALIDNDQSITYELLNKKTNMIARSFKKNGISEGKTLAIICKKDFDTVCIMLAGWKAGAKVLLIEPTLPIKRIELILSCINDIKIYNNCIDLDENFKNFELNIGDEYIEKESCENLYPKIIREDDAAIVFTSGSTGIPKGVYNNHASIINYVKYMNDYLHIDFIGNTMHYCSCNFGFFYTEFCSMITNGSTIYFIDKEKRNNIEYLFDFINQRKITTCFLPTAILKLFTKIDKYRDSIPDCLNCIIVAGESLTLNEDFCSVLNMKNIKLYNNYGCSETGSVLFHEVDFKKDDIKNIPLGVPVLGMKAYVLNDDLKQTKINQKGNLFLSGEGLTRGYINREDMKEKFIINPFSRSEIIYDTGDVCKLNDKKEIVYIGRKDNQVKIRSCRVELEDVERQILENNDIIEAAVVLMQDNFMNNRLIAAIKMKESLDLNHLKNWLKEKLPAYMMPSQIISLDELPKNKSGKIDRIKLSNYLKNTISNSEKNNEKDEDKFLNIISKILNCDFDKENIKNNFEMIGMDSISFVAFICEIEQTFGFKFEMEEVTSINYESVESFWNLVQSKIKI